jgi:cytochrome P450
MRVSAGAEDVQSTDEVPADLAAAARGFDPNTRNTDGRLWERTAELRRTCPVFVSEQMDGFTAVVDHDLVTEAMRNWRTFSSADGALLRQAARDFRLYPFELDPPLHTRIKGCLSPLFTKARVRLLEPEIREIVVGLIDGFARRGECELMSEFAFPLSGRVVYERLLGGPPEDQQRVFGWVSEFILRPEGPEALTALAALRDWTVEVLERPGETGRPEVVQALLDLRVDGRPLSDDERAMTNVLLVLAAFESTALAVGNIFLYLLRHPDLLARMRSDPHARLEVKVAIEEVFTRLPGLRLTEEEVVFGQGQNWGPTALHVAWERA